MAFLRIFSGVNCRQFGLFPMERTGALGMVYVTVFRYPLLPYWTIRNDVNDNVKGTLFGQPVTKFRCDAYSGYADKTITSMLERNPNNPIIINIQVCFYSYYVHKIITT